MPEPAASSRLASIQYRRAVAALMALGYRIVGEARVIKAAGADVFFVISGLAIGMRFDPRPKPLAHQPASGARTVKNSSVTTAKMGTRIAIDQAI